MDEMKVGAKVKLKSGGPRMTVEHIGNWGGVRKAKCFWFDGTDLKSGLFSLDTLEPDDGDT